MSDSNPPKTMPGVSLARKAAPMRTRFPGLDIGAGAVAVD
jgi:hypothetical protein